MNTKVWEREWDWSECILSLAHAWGHLDMSDALVAKQSTVTEDFMNLRLQKASTGGQYCKEFARDFIVRKMILQLMEEMGEGRVNE